MVSQSTPEVKGVTAVVLVTHSTRQGGATIGNIHMPAKTYTLNRRPLLSANERPAERVLQEVGERHGFRIFPQVKLSQVIHDLPPGLTNREWNYATRATFDFVVCHAETLIPDFAVELDDGTHWQASVRQRDRMKDTICERAGFELLRIEAQHLVEGPLGRRLLEYLIDARDYCRNIYDLQQQGSLPWDEIFDYRLVADGMSDGHINYVNDLTGPTIRAVRAAYERGLLSECIVHTLSFDWSSGWSEAWAWIKVRDALFLFASTRVRSYSMFFCSISPDDLAADLSTAVIGAQVVADKQNEPALVTAEAIGDKWAHLRARRQYLRDPEFLDHLHWGGR